MNKKKQIFLITGVNSTYLSKATAYIDTIQKYCCDIEFYRLSIRRLKNNLDSLKESRFILSITLLYAFFSLLNLINHEMWRDELQAWAIAKNSSTFTELFRNLRYEGHPALWYWILYLVGRFTGNLIAMQFCHAAIAMAVIYILLKYSPFSRIQKVMFVFGYFFIYEYAVISRAYAIELLFIFCFCAMYNRERKNYIALSLVLSLLAQTTIFGLIIAISLVMMLGLEIFTNSELRMSLAGRKGEMVLSALIFALGIIFFAITVAPPPDSRWAEWNNNFSLSHLKKVVGAVWKGYIPIPRIGHNFWNTSLFLGKKTPFVLGILTLVYAGLIFIRRPKILFLFCVGNVGILTFFYLKYYYGAARHNGHLFIMFVVCLWLCACAQERQLKSGFMNITADFVSLHKNQFLTAILIIHVIVGIYAISMERIYPFSESKNVAKFIRDNHMDNLPIVGDRNYAILPVCGYLRKEMYDPRSGRVEWFTVFDKKALVDTSVQEIIGKAKDLAVQQATDVLVILNYKPETEPVAVNKIKEFTNGIVDDEQYYLYLLKSNAIEIESNVTAKKY